ncbi:MAG TPA: AAA family ATPase [Caldimonas sp.]|nr:AAA family ATPase [Caldimonas sp.]HEX4234366.1 AAA family ATPase [Caldimonas sp.]
MGELLERDGPLAALTAAADAAARGDGRTLLVSGEAGIGKTSMLERFGANLGRGRILWGACEALATPRPLGPLHDVAAAAGSAVRAALARAGDRAALFAAVLDELARPPAPTVMVFEDLHWADAATLDLVKYLGRRIQHVPALLVLSHRDDTASLDKLRDVLGNLPPAHVTRLLVPPLSRTAVERLAAGARRRDGGGVHAATGGNAFFVAEVLRHGGATGDVPVTVRDAVLARAAMLSADAHDLLQLVAIVPRQVDLGLVGDVLAPSTATIEVCLASGLLVADSANLRFRHELARTAIEEAIALPRAAALHRRVLAALEARPQGEASLAARAHHAQKAGDGDAIRRWSPPAAREAALRGARREAAAHCRAALEHGSRLAVAERAALLDELATHCFELNELEPAIAAREAAIELHGVGGDIERQSEALAAHAMSLVRALRNADADAAGRRALDLAATLPPGRALARAQTTESYLRMLNRDYDDAITWGQKAIALAEGAGDLATLARAYLTLGAATMFVDYAQGCAHVDRSLELARSLDDGGAGVADAHVMLGTASGELHEFAAAERYLEAGIAFARAHDLDRLAGYMEGWQALCDVHRGRWVLAGERANVVVARELGGTTNRVVALLALGRLRTRRGDPGAAAVLDEALELALRSGTLQRLGPVCAARAEAAWLDGDGERAAREAERAFDLAVAKRHPWLLGELAFWRHRAGALTAPPRGSAAPFRLQIAGRATDAAAAWRAMGCAYEEARALADGDEPAQRAALAILDRLGAKPLADRVRRQMRQSGVRAVPRGAVTATRSNEAGLTARELEVLALVADGCRNAQIADRLSRSARTVEHHVESILAKLGVASRTEAVAAARRIGLLAKNG